MTKDQIINLYGGNTHIAQGIVDRKINEGQCLVKPLLHDRAAAHGTS